MALDPVTAGLIANLGGSLFGGNNNSPQPQTKKDNTPLIIGALVGGVMLIVMIFTLTSNKR